jgi:hypothetical protein
MHPYFQWARRGRGRHLLWLLRRACSSGISWRIHFLVKMALYRHRAGFEPQRASPFMKKVKASRILGETVRASTIIPLFVLPFTLLVVLASSTSGDQHFYEIVKLCRPSPQQDWGRARTAGNRFVRDEKEPGFRRRNRIPGERPPETAETRHTSSSAHPTRSEERRRSA